MRNIISGSGFFLANDPDNRILAWEVGESSYLESEVQLPDQRDDIIVQKLNDDLFLAFNVKS